MNTASISKLRSLLALPVFLAAASASAGGALGPGLEPREPIEIASEPQYFADDYIVDNHWAFQASTQSVRRVFHAPKKYENNPVIAGDGGYVSVERDHEAGLFRLWHQAYDADRREQNKSPYGIAYAQSRDGITWELPDVGRYEWKGSRNSNIVWMGPEGRGAGAGGVLALPEEARNGHRYVMIYHTHGGMFLVGSQDGIDWDPESVTLIGERFHPDTCNSIVWDSRRGEFVWFTRATNLYSGRPHEGVDGGASRRVARLSNAELWTRWEINPQTILLPDNADMDEQFNYFYGMPTKYHAGIYWGMLWPFKRNTDIYTELVTSRDGYHFKRFPGRPRLIEFGEEGSWDSGMIFAAPGWVEVGDEWWIYYAGHDGAHGSKDRTAGIGLAKIRKEGFVSLRGPANGGVIVTRTLRWPGGNLLLNGDASAGEIGVRVSDPQRNVIEGFDYADSLPLRENRTTTRVAWRERSLDELRGEEVRLEFFVHNADLFSFRADPDQAVPEPEGAAAWRERAVVPDSFEDLEELPLLMEIPLDEGAGDPAVLGAEGARVQVGDGEDPATYPEWLPAGEGMRFAGEFSHLRIVADSGYARDVGTARLEMRFRPEETVTEANLDTNAYLAYLRESSARRAGLMLEGRTGKLVFFYLHEDAGKPMRVESDADTWEAGQWRHVAVTVGGQGLQMYVDGRLQGGGDASATIGLDAMKAGSFHIGSGSAWHEGDYGFRGAIRDIRLRGR